MLMVMHRNMITTIKLLSPPEKMTTDHLFDIASLTKVIGTTTSVMLLADRGLIKIEDPVYKYIKAFDTPDKRRITIRHLLTHTAGLYEWYPLYYRAQKQAGNIQVNRGASSDVSCRGTAPLQRSGIYASG